MSSNEISDINVLEKTNFKELKYLGLSSNKISDISVFENFKLNNLEKLDIKYNEINLDKYSLLIEKLEDKIKSFEYGND